MTHSSDIYLAVEGIDGTGKTFVTRHIAEKFGFTKIQEPSNGPIGSLIENGNWDPSTDFFLFMADRVELLKIVHDKKNIVSDRSLYSSYAYQGVYLKNYFGNFDEYFHFFMSAAKLVPLLPTHIFVLYCDVNVALKRVNKRGESSRFERAEYLKGVQDLYFNLKDKISNVTYIDSNVSLDELYGNVDDRVISLLRQARPPEEK